MSHTYNKLSGVGKKQILVAVRKGLMAADVNYHALPLNEQERFRVTMDEKFRDKIRQVLLECLLDIKCAIKDIDRIWEDMPSPELIVLNWASLLTSGIGEDFIYLNEYMQEGKSLLDFTTLNDYDYDDYQYQEEAKQRDFPEYKGSEYYAFKHPPWVRMLIHEEFYYATFTSLATYLTDAIDVAGSDYINELIPHEYIEGKDHQKREDTGFLWDMKIDAAGQEGQLDELNSRWYHYTQERWLELSKLFCDLPPAVYTQDADWDDDPHRFFIFNNAGTLRKIRWRNFLSDCEPLMAKFLEVSIQLAREIKNAKIWLAIQNEDIMKNFDPNIVKFRKKKKIVMSAQFMVDMNRIHSGDEPQE